MTRKLVTALIALTMTIATLLSIRPAGADAADAPRYPTRIPAGTYWYRQGLFTGLRSANRPRQASMSASAQYDWSVPGWQLPMGRQGYRAYWPENPRSYMEFYQRGTVNGITTPSSRTDFNYAIGCPRPWQPWDPYRGPRRPIFMRRLPR